MKIEEKKDYKISSGDVNVQYFLGNTNFSILQGSTEGLSYTVSITPFSIKNLGDIVAILTELQAKIKEQEGENGR